MAALLERERELTAFTDVLSEARQGRGQVVLVEAPAGLGKTSLLKAVSETATEAGFISLRARASELERDFAYGCVRQLLEPLVARASEPERTRLFDGAGSLSAPLFAASDAPQRSHVTDTSVSILHGLYWLLNNLAVERPLVLSVDDLHWSDVASLRFLAYLAPRLDGLPLTVFASRRTGEGVTDELARLAAAPETTVLRPRPLSIEATTTLCERRLGAKVAPEFAASCRDATGGNPFFLEALLREASEQGLSTDAQEASRLRRIGPAAVAHAVLLRLSGKPAASALVRAVAVLGDGASLGEASRLAELSVEEASRAADLLGRLAILKPADDLEFAHPIVREAVYVDIGAHERAQAHARAADILAGVGASEERIAAQIAEAEPTGAAEWVELLRRVAEGALVRGAPTAAASYLRRALAEPPPPKTMAEVLRELGSAELRVGAPEAVDHLTMAVELIEDPRLLTIAVRELALALTMSGKPDQAVEAIESALTIVEPADRELALVLEADLEAHAQQAGFETRAPAAWRLEQHSNLEGATPAERLVLASLAFERARASESASVAARHLERGLANGRMLAEQELDVAGSFYHLVIGLLATDALELADACLEQAIEDARARGSIPAFGLVTAYQAKLSLRQGAVEQAEANARTALELLTTHDVRLGIPFTLAFLIEALIERGELDAAERSLRSSGLAEDIPPGLTTNFLLEARGLLNLAQGRMRHGLDDLVEFGRRDELWGGASLLASRWRSRASLAFAATGDGEQARLMASDDLQRAQRWGAASGIGVALRAVALVEEGAVSIEHLRNAVDVLEHSSARLEYARALTDFGAALRRANRRTEARSALQEGMDLAERLGAAALVERGSSELRAAGGRSRRPRGTGLEQLTASERRVADLAAEGHSNPEIAQALFVTRKTVETHLGRVYRKLQISHRGELPRALAHQGPYVDG